MSTPVLKHYPFQLGYIIDRRMVGQGSNRAEQPGITRRGEEGRRSLFSLFGRRGSRLVYLHPIIGGNMTVFSGMTEVQRGLRRRNGRHNIAIIHHSINWYVSQRGNEV